MNTNAQLSAKDGARPSTLQLSLHRSADLPSRILVLICIYISKNFIGHLLPPKSKVVPLGEFISLRSQCL